MLRNPRKLDSLSDSRDRLHCVLEDAQYSHRLCKAKQIAETNGHNCKPSDQVGDRTRISHQFCKESYSTAQASSKLSARGYGRFEITKPMEKNADRLKIPSHIRINLVIHVLHTKPHHEQPKNLARKAPTTPDPVDSTAAATLFEVNRILAQLR